MEQLKKALEELNIAYNPETIQKFQKYMDGILEFNKSINLTAITEKKEFINKHFIDSLKIATSKEFQRVERIADVGTGGGFPGIPLAIIAPEKEFILMDSLNKRLKVVEELATSIGINNIKVVHGRAEDLGQKQEYRESIPLVVSRAVAAMPVLAEYCLPLVEVGGCFVSYKGPAAKQELDDAVNAIKILGGKVDRIVKVENEFISSSASNQDPFNNDNEQEKTDHNLIFINKVNKTPTKYPRKAGTPTKQPL